MVKKILIVFVLIGLISALGRAAMGNEGYMGMRETISYLSQTTFFDQDIVDTFTDIVEAFSLDHWAEGVNRYTEGEEDPSNPLQWIAHIAKAIWGVMQTIWQTMAQITVSVVMMLSSIFQNIYYFVRFLMYGIFGMEMP